MNKNVIVLGGDGFCGWPSSLHLSKCGYNVTIVDNLIRRKIDVELECDSLTPIKSINKRIETWKELTGKIINFEYIDIAKEYHKLLNLLKKLKPIVVVHFAEQRSAPYSMKTNFHKSYTINNNINATNNILMAIVEAELQKITHFVHLGTTGSAGYVTTPMDIPEGYLNVDVKTDNGIEMMEFPWPLHSPSIYHWTKSAEFLLFQFFNKNDGIQCSDLRQGIVWGTQTKETVLHENLINRFDYEGDYGTCLNRFLMQSQINHPLTVHGTGGQTRAFIHIQNTVECIELAIKKPPENKNKVRVLNQVTECMNVKDLAELISKKTGCEIRYFKNPRVEAEENSLRFNTRGFKELGLNFITLNNGLLNEIIKISKKYKHRCNKSKVICTSLWNKNRTVDLKGSKTPVKG